MNFVAVLQNRLGSLDLVPHTVAQGCAGVGALSALCFSTLGGGVLAAGYLGWKWLPYAKGKLCLKQDRSATDQKGAFSWFQYGAEQGNRSCMFHLGLCYENGIGTPKDLERAAHWYLEGAKRGEINCINNIGACYEFGDGVPQDENEAYKWYLRGAQLGNPRAMNNLGMCCEKGIGTPINKQDALEWYLTGVRFKSEECMTSLGKFYEKRGTGDDQKEALSWYTRAGNEADKEHLLAVRALEKNCTKEAVDHFLRSANLGNTTAMDWLGDHYSSQGDTQQAVLWYKKGAEAEPPNPKCIVKYALNLKTADPQVAIEWFQRGARLEDAGCMYRLGLLFQDTDPDTAFMWFQKGAAQSPNCRKSFTNLCFQRGIKETDQKKAQEYFEKGAQLDHADCMHRLGLLLQDTDPNAAFSWFAKGTSQSTDCARSLSNLCYELAIKENDLDSAQWYFKRGAALGNLSCMHKLAILLQDTDPKEATDWFEKGAKSGHVDCMYRFGLLLRYTDPQAALMWFEKGASESADCKRSLISLCYQQGVAEKDLNIARKYLEKGAELNDVECMYKLGVRLQDTGPPAAIKWFQKGADLGNVDCMYRLGICLQDTDPNAAINWFQKGADLGNVDCMYGLGMLLKDKNPETAQTWFKKGAEATPPNAECIYLHAHNMARTEGPFHPDVIGWYRKGADLDNVNCIFALAKIDLYGSGTGEIWYRKGVALNDVRCFYPLGKIVEKSGKYDEAFELFVKGAELNDLQCMVQLSSFLLNDNLSAFNPSPAQVQTALFWCKKGVMIEGSSSHDLSEHELKRFIFDGQTGSYIEGRWCLNCLLFYFNKTKSLSDSFAFFQEAATKHKRDWSYEILGDYFRIGKGTEVDLEAAVRWYTEGANAGNPHCMKKLGDAYLKGWGDRLPNLAEAQRCYRNGAQLDHAECVYQLWLLLKGPNPDEALSWLEKGAKLKHPECMFHLAQHHERLNDLTQAVKYYTDAAVYYSHVPSMEKLGDYYIDRNRGPLRDLVKAFYWYDKGLSVSKRKNAACMYKLGCMYKPGSGWVPNLPRAIEFFRSGAALGHSDCMYELGLEYARISKFRDAVHWFLKSATPKAYQSLGDHYSTGQGCEKDTQKAIHFYQLSVAQGNEEARGLLNQLLAASQLIN